MLALTELARIRKMLGGDTEYLSEEQQYETFIALANHCEESLVFSLGLMEPLVRLDPGIRESYNRLVRLVNLLRFGKNDPMAEIKAPE